MDQRTLRRHRKITLAHKEKCWKCGHPKRSSCSTSNCPVIHCACALTEGGI